MSRKIIGVTVGTTLPKPNFDQTDPSKGDYIRGDRSFLNMDDTLSITGRPADAKATGDAINQMQISIDEIAGLVGEFDNKYYTETEIDSMIDAVNAAVDAKSDADHVHDDLYYTETEIDNKLGEMQSSIDSKVDKDGDKVLSTNDYTTAERDKLANIEDNANFYEHPTHSSHSFGLYKVTVDDAGHVSDATLVDKEDIVALGIPAQDTTYDTEIADLSDRIDEVENSINTTNETLNGVSQDFEDYKESNNEAVSTNASAIEVNKTDIEEIKSDYLTSTDRTQLQDNITEVSNKATENASAIEILNGEGDGSVKKSIDNAFNEFAANVTNDDVINTYKELIDYAAEHGPEFTALVGKVDTIETDVGEIETDLSNYKTIVSTQFSEFDTIINNHINDAQEALDGKAELEHAHSDLYYDKDEIAELVTVEDIDDICGSNVIIGGGDASAVSYATKQWVQDGYQPKGNYLTSVPAGYATEEFVRNQIADAELGSTGTGSGGYIVDATLTQSGQAADAKAVGEALADKAELSDVFSESLQPQFTNIFDTVPIEFGKLLEPDGTVKDTNASLCITGYIPVSTGDVIRVNESFPLYNSSTAGTPKIIIYDSAQAKLNHFNLNIIANDNYWFTVTETNADGHILTFRVNKPSNAAYMRICNNTSVVGVNPVLTINEEIAYIGHGTNNLNQKIGVKLSQILDSPLRKGWDILPTEHIEIAYSGIGKRPMNTVEHFAYAATNCGFNTLKADLRPTSDGELICCHDAGFTFHADGYITTYDSTNQTLIHDVTAETCLGYTHKWGEHPCLVGDYLKICRTYGKVAFITIRDEYMDVVIPKLISELKIHNMLYSTIINSMTYESLVKWRNVDNEVMVNYTLSYGYAITATEIDKAASLGNASLSGFALNSSQVEPTADCDFEYARERGIRLGQAIAYTQGSPEKCFEMGYDMCTIGYPWKPTLEARLAALEALVNTQ